MKFIDLLKEPSEERLLKKAKTIFLALRKGKITRKDGVSFSYELSSITNARVYEGEILLLGSVISIKELTYCPINQRYMTELIENKFKMFDINVELRPPNDNQIEKYQGKKPWEKDEPIELNEEADNNLTEKQRKKIELIYGIYKTGKYQMEDLIYNYVLPDEYWTSIDDETGELTIVLTMNPQQRMELYASMERPNGDITNPVPVETEYRSLWDNAKQRIKNKFERHNIQIIF